MADTESVSRPNLSDQNHVGRAEQEDVFGVHDMSDEQLEGLRNIIGVAKADTPNTKKSLVRLAIELNVTDRLYRGQVLLEQNNFRQADKVFNEACEIADIISDRTLKGRCYFWRGVTHAKLDSLEQMVFAFFVVVDSFVDFWHEIDLVNMEPPFGPSQPCLEMRLLPRYLRAYHEQIDGKIIEISDSEDGAPAMRTAIETIMQKDGGSLPSFNPSHGSHLFEGLWNELKADPNRSAQIISDQPKAPHAVSEVLNRISIEPQGVVDSLMAQLKNGGPRRPVGSNTGLRPRTPYVAAQDNNRQQLMPRPQPQLSNTGLDLPSIDGFLQAAEYGASSSSSASDQIVRHPNPLRPASEWQYSEERPDLNRGSRQLWHVTSRLPSSSSPSPPESEQHHVASTEATLSETLTPDALEQRAQEATGRRRSLTDVTLAGLRIDTSSDVSASGPSSQVRTLRRQSTEPTNSSPLRASFVAED